ncbi:MAG: FIST C-terminal domain-containing protein, partial [Oscillospiraceae bacterium]|nr:FIST C-terminal domain-containing protein [Oscillospiraceae bacterium]
ITAGTNEVDNVEIAVNSVKSKVKTNELLKNTIGLLVFHHEFELSGVVERILSSFDFPIIGITTVLNGFKDNKGDFAQGELFLSLTIMTSDDVFFDMNITEEILCEISGENVCKETRAACEAVLFKQFMDFDVKSPKAIFAFTPNYLVGHGGHVVDTISELIPNVPLFGAAAVDDSPSFMDDSFIVTNVCGYRKSYRSIGFIEIYGNANPKFYSVSISNKKILGKQAIITSAKDNKIFSLNEKPVIDFLNSLGLTDFLIQNGAISELSLMIKEDDTMPIYSRTMIDFDKENGILSCGAFVKEGSLLSIGLFERADMLSIMEQAFKTAVETAEKENMSLLLAFSCATRYVVFGADNLSELEIMNEFSGNLPYMAAYAGGELCPVSKESGENINRYNNQSFSICII